MDGETGGSQLRRGFPGQKRRWLGRCVAIGSSGPWLEALRVDQSGSRGFGALVTGDGDGFRDLGTRVRGDPAWMGALCGSVGGGSGEAAHGWCGDDEGVLEVGRCCVGFGWGGALYGGAHSGFFGLLVVFLSLEFRKWPVIGKGVDDGGGAVEAASGFSMGCGRRWWNSSVAQVWLVKVDVWLDVRRVLRGEAFCRGFLFAFYLLHYSSSSVARF